MLDKLKDIVPEVNENKANLIYQKSIKPKFRFNYQLVLKFAIILIVFVPVFVIMGLNNSGDLGNESTNSGNVKTEDAMPEEIITNSPGVDIPADDSCGEVEEDLKDYVGEYNNGVLNLYFPGEKNVYYLKEFEGYKIVSVIVDGNEIASNGGIYLINSSNVSIVFNTDNIDDKVLILISSDSENFNLKQINVK